MAPAMRISTMILTKPDRRRYSFTKTILSLDIGLTPQFTSGKANEIAGSTMIDWPGRPGTKVSPFSSHQIIERGIDASGRISGDAQ